MDQNLPTGTVTFLFTDIEGSTNLWQHHREEMPVALAQHHAILNQTIAAHGGYVFQIIGDAFCAAFSTAINGLEAALAAQRALRDANWGETGAIRVRMALHTGVAEVKVGEHTSGEYVSSLTLSRAARLLSTGHGGQILLSLTAAELVRDHLPEGTVLCDLGSHRLKDLIHPEHIYQAVVADLPSEFLPIKTLDTHPNNLPVQLTSFIGREQEMARVKGILSSTRLITLTGVGGGGKTRLAIQVAADLIDEFPDGVWYVEFAPLTDPALVPQSVAKAVGLQLQSGRTVLLELAEYLRQRNCLLLFDNCEHLIEACAQLTDELLHACPNQKILATSREGLDIMGEVIYQVPSLATPAVEAPTAQSLNQYEAVRLFIDRAAMIQPGFTLTDQNAASVAQICYHLDGIPLAIELAAARVNSLSVEQISERLGDRFRLLTSGRRTALPRHQTLRALIDWSYSLLSAEERLLFERLSVFSGGWMLEAAESICAGDGIESFEIINHLHNLVTKSLVVVGESVEAKVHYSFLETIRQYAQDKLVSSGKLSVYRDRHLDWFLDFEEHARPKLFGPQQVSMLNILEQEHDNLRAALTWSMETAIEKGLRLATGLHRFWRLRAYWYERLDWLNKLLAQQKALTPTRTRAYALIARGDLELSKGEYADAENSFLESLQISRQLNDEKGIAEVLGELARLSIEQGNFLQAGRLSQESQDIARRTGDTYLISQALNSLAYVLCMQGNCTKANELLRESVSLYSQMVDMSSIQNFIASPQTQNPYFILALNEQDQGNFQEARKVLEEGLAFFRTAGSLHEIAWFLRYLANLSLREGNLAHAHTLYQEGLQIVRDMKDKYCISHALDGLAQVEHGKGNYEQAVLLATQSLNLCEQIGSKQRIARAQCILGLAMLHTNLSGAEKMLNSSLTMRDKLGNKSDLAESLSAMAKMYILSGSFERAAKLFAAANVLFESIFFKMTPCEKSDYETILNNIRTELGDETFTAAWKEGRGMSWEQVLKLALR